MSNFTDQYTLTARDNTKSAFRSFNSNVDTAGRSVRRLAGFAAGLAGAYGFGALIRSSMTLNDELAKTADRLGFTTTELGGLHHAVDQMTQLSTGSFDTAMQRMVRRLSEVEQRGAGPAKDALDALGLSIDELKGLSTQEQLYAISDAMQGLERESTKVRVAFQLFESEGVRLLNMLDGGSEGLRAMEADAEKLGLTVSRIDAARLEAANDSLDRTGKVMRGAGNDMAIAVAPAIEAVANLFVDASTEAGGFAEVATTGMDYLVRGIGLAADGFYVFRALWPGLKMVANQAIASILAGLGAVEDGFRRMADFIPGITVRQHGWFTETAKGFQDTADAARAEIVKLMQGEFPSITIDRYYQNAKDKSADAAAAIEAANERVAGMGDALSNSDDNNLFDASDIQKLEEQLMSKEQKILHSYQQQRRIVQEAHAHEHGITEQHRDRLLNGLRDHYREKMAEIIEAEEKEAQAKEQARQREVDQVARFLMTEEQRIRASYAQRIAIVEQNVQDEDRAEQMRQQLQERRQQELTDLEKRGAEDRVRWSEWEARQKVAWSMGAGSQILSALDNFQSATNAQSEAEFERQKRFSKSVAIINGLAASIKAFAEMPWWQAAAASTAILLNTAATVRKIDNQKWNDSSSSVSAGNGGSSGSGGGDANSGSVTDQLSDSNSQSETHVMVEISGDMAAFARATRAYTRDTGDNLIDPDSDNARRISRRSAA